MYRKGDQIGPYTLVEKLGRGGFGVVWLAEKRTALAATRVALKLSHDEDVNLDVIRQEASVWIEASGHPNVLPIIDADIYDDQVVIVSEYAPDGSLERWLKKHGGRAPSVPDAVEMADGILAGLEHLHSKRIIHRDLKPANILLQGDTPRLVDFGLARVLKNTSHSNTVSGTYAYMPPETFEGQRSEQTDLWSAGVILYEMLTGRLPYPQETDAMLVGAILHKTPDPMPGWCDPRLANVVMRSLQKDLAVRFRSATDMRQALRVATTGSLTQDSAPTSILEPLPASGVDGPVSYGSGASSRDVDSPYKTTPMGADFRDSLSTITNQNISGTGPASFDTREGGTIHRSLSPTVSFESSRSDALSPTSVDHFSSNANPSLGFAPTGRQKSKSRLLLIAGLAVLVLAVVGSVFAFRYFLSRNHVSDPTPKPTASTPGTVAPGTIIEPAGKPIGTLTTKSSVLEVAISPDGKLSASVGNDNAVRLWRINESNEPVILNGHTKTVRTVALSPDGQTVVSGGDDQTVRLWRASDGGLLRALSGHTAWVFRVAFSPDGQTVASAGGDKTIRIWNVADGALKSTLQLPDAAELVINISPDLQRVALYHPTTKLVRIWSINDNKVLTGLGGEKFEVSGGAFAPDNATLAIGSRDGAVRIFTVADGKPVRSLTGKTGQTGTVAFDATGQVAAAGYGDGSICIWRVNDGKLLRTLTGHSKFVLGLAFSSDDRVLASGGEDMTIRFWEVLGQ